MPPSPTREGAKVLFLSTQQIFPPQSGGHLRSCGLARALQNGGFDVFVYSMVGRKEGYLGRRPSAIHKVA